MAKKEVYAEEEAQRILPLLVSIGREIKNRAREIDEAETRMGRLVSPADAHAKATLQAELAQPRALLVHLADRRSDARIPQVVQEQDAHDVSRSKPDQDGPRAAACKPERPNSAGNISRSPSGGL